MNFVDTVSLGGARVTADGYLVADAKVARTGIQLYSGAEMGKPDMETVRIYRPEDEVFAQPAMGSFAARPVTNDHPDEPVGADNWKRHAVGFTGEGVARDGGYLRVPLVLMDRAAVDAVKGGKRELSAGYSCDVDWTPGQTTAGETYDAVQRNIRGNHLAIVSVGRAGSACRIGDNHDARSRDDTGTPTMTDKPLRTVAVDGLSIETTDQGAQVITKLQGEIEVLKNDKAILETKLSTDAGAHVAALATKDGEIAALKAQVPDAATLDAALEERLQVMVDAASILGEGFDPAGKSVADIKRQVVATSLGEPAIAGKDAAFIGGAYDALVATAKALDRPADPVRDAIRGGLDSGRQDTADAAYQEMLTRTANAWRAPSQKGAA